MCMMHRRNVPVLINKKKKIKERHSIPFPLWVTDNNLHYTLLTLFHYKTHGGLDSHLFCHAF